MSNQRGIALIVIILIIIGVLAVGGGIWYWQSQKKAESVVCTQEAKLCPDGSSVGRTGPNCEFAACPSEQKIYSVDELVESNNKEETEVLVKGRYNAKLISEGPDYEGPGGGSYLFGEKESLYLGSNGIKSVEPDQIITVKGKVRYCGGKKIAKYICGLTDVSLVYNESTSWSEANCTDSDNGKNIYKNGWAKTVDNKGVTLHITADSCATKLEKNYPSGEPRYLQGLASCSGGNCFVEEGYCNEYKGGTIDGGEFIQCPNGCNDGACVSNWKTYRNEQYGFEVKIPSDWVYQEITNENKINFDTKTTAFNVSLSIMNQDVEKVVEKIKQDYKSFPFQWKIQEIGKIDDHKTYSLNECDLGCCGLTIYISKDESHTISINGGTFCSVGTDEEKKRFENIESIFNQILSTFKFTK